MAEPGQPTNDADLLRRFRSTTDQAERMQIVQQIGYQPSQDEAKEALKALLLGEVVVSEPDRANQYRLVSGAIVPDDWRNEAYRILIKNLCSIDEAFSFIRQVSTENDDPNCWIEATGILSQYFPKHPQTFGVLTQWADQYSRHAYSGHAEAKALSAIVENYSHLPEARRYLMRATESTINLAPREAAIEALGKHHARHQENRPDLEKIAMRGSSADRAELDFSSLRAKQEQEAAAAAVRTLARNYPDSYEFVLKRAEQVVAPMEARAVFYSLAEAFSERPEAVTVLIDRARRGASAGLRQCAVEVLHLFASHNPQVLPLLLERATEDPDRWPRQSAVRGLATRYARISDAEVQIISSAKSDPSEIVRTAAVNMLREHFPRNRNAMACLIDRRNNDDHQDVRRAAGDALADGFSQFSKARRALRSSGYLSPEGRLKKLVRGLFKNPSKRQ